METRLFVMTDQPTCRSNLSLALVDGACHVEAVLQRGDARFGAGAPSKEPAEPGLLLQFLAALRQGSAGWQRRVTALRYLEELGDERAATALESLPGRFANRGRAGAVRDTAIRLRGRLQPDPSGKYEFWIKYLDDEGATLEDAVDALGDLGDKRVIPALVKLEKEASSPRDPVEPESKREYFRRLVLPRHYPSCSS